MRADDWARWQADRSRVPLPVRQAHQAKAKVLSRLAAWVAKIGPAMADLDAVHVTDKERTARARGPRQLPLVVLPPPAVVPPVLSRADLACARVASAPGRQHVIHPFQVGGEAGRMWCVVCVVCGYGGTLVSASLSTCCAGPPQPKSWGARVLSNLGRTPARFSVNKEWRPLVQPLRSGLLIRAGESGPSVT
eukprot:801024-Pyramimonas_sp.AAC.1